MPKKKPEPAADCDCLACKLQSVIIDQVAAKSDDDVFQIDAREALSALLPTVGMLLTAVEYADAETWWLAALSERSASMLPDDVDFGEAYKGRA